MADYTRLGNLPTKFKQSDMLQPDSYEMGSLCGSSDTDDPRIEHEGIAPTTDDPSTPSLTFRVYFLGTVWCVALGAVNSVFAFRTSPFAVPAFLATLLSYPMGLFMAATLPRKVAGSTFLNPGRFSAKEHVLITIIASAGASVAYGIDNVVAQKSLLFMVININKGARINYVLGSTFLGISYSVCGIWHIWPRSPIPHQAIFNGLAKYFV